MGRVLLVYRLAARDLRRHAGQAVLLLLVIAATTTTLTLGLVLHGVTQNPWDRTMVATDGPDVVAQVLPPPAAQSSGAPSSAADLAQLRALAHAPGVTGASGLIPSVMVNIVARGITFPVFAEGRGAARSGIDRPALTSGTWVRPGGVVLDRNLADALRVGAGDTVTLGGRQFRVVGTAVTAAQGQTWVPGLVWLTTAGTRSLVSRKDPVSYLLNLKLADPATAQAFSIARSTEAISLMPWQQVQRSDSKVITVVQIVLLVGTWLLGLLAVASVAVLVGGRMADQTRRVGLLKAVGGTPRLVAVVLLAEHLMLALAATVVGLAVGWLAAPLLTSPGDALLGAAGAPTLTGSTVLIATCVAVGVAVIATLVPAIRAARTSTIRALNDPARPPRRAPRLIALSARLPVPLLLGLRLASRRPRRSILATISLVITVTMVVAALTMKYGFDLRNAAPTQLGSVPRLLNQPIQDRISQVVGVLTVMLGVLAAINTVFITEATALDAQRPAALARAFGTTPRQVTAGLCAAQLLPAVIAVIVGIPAGLGLYRLAAQGATHGHELALAPPIWWLVAVLPGTLLVVGVLTAIPARISARRPVALVLRAE